MDSPDSPAPRLQILKLKEDVDHSPSPPVARDRALSDLADHVARLQAQVDASRDLAVLMREHAALGAECERLRRLAFEAIDLLGSESPLGNGDVCQYCAAALPETAADIDSSRPIMEHLRCRLHMIAPPS